MARGGKFTINSSTNASEGLEIAADVIPMGTYLKPIAKTMKLKNEYEISSKL